MTDPNNLEGPGRTPEEMAAAFRELVTVAPTPADRFALMFGRPRPPAGYREAHDDRVDTEDTNSLASDP